MSGAFPTELRLRLEHGISSVAGAERIPIVAPRKKDCTVQQSTAVNRVATTPSSAGSCSRRVVVLLRLRDDATIVDEQFVRSPMKLSNSSKSVLLESPATRPAFTRPDALRALEVKLRSEVFARRT